MPGADADVVIAKACPLIIDVGELPGSCAEFVGDGGTVFEKDCNTCERRWGLSLVREIQRDLLFLFYKISITSGGFAVAG